MRCVARVNGLVNIISWTVYSPGCVGVHGFSSVWGLIAVGLFTRKGESLSALGFVPSEGGLIYVRRPYLIQHYPSSAFSLLGVGFSRFVVGASRCHSHGIRSCASYI